MDIDNTVADPGGVGVQGTAVKRTNTVMADTVAAVTVAAVTVAEVTVAEVTEKGNPTPLPHRGHRRNSLLRDETNRAQKSPTKQVSI